MDRVEATIHRTKGDAVILELAFHGQNWQHDSEIREVVRSAVKDCVTAGILLDLSKFRYRGGDYASGFFEAFPDREHDGIRPACFVQAPTGVRSLFDVIDVGGKLGVRFFDDRANAIDYLIAQLEATG